MSDFTATVTTLRARADLAQNQLKLLRHNISLAASDGYNADQLGNLVRDLAVAEGATAVYVVAANIARNYDAAEVVRYITDTLLGSPDDTWSGRGNDIRRSAADGTRDAARFVLITVNGL